MAISQKQLAERWEITAGRVSQLVSEGMPLTSFEDAERWRAERHMETGHHPAGFTITPNENAGNNTELENFDQVIQHQRGLVALARDQYVNAVREGSPQQSKLYASYDKTVNTLTKLKAEWDRLSVMNRDYIRATDSADAMKTLMAEVVNRLDKLSLDCAEGCNPENPAKAVKVLDAWKRKVMGELSKKV